MDGNPGRRRKHHKSWVTFSNWMVNEGPAQFVAVAWIAIQLARFGYIVYFYDTNANYRTMRTVLGWSLPVARGAAAAITINCTLILLPVCRNIISSIRSSWLNRLVPIDKNIKFHKLLGWCICFWTFVHVGAHMFNFLHLQQFADGLVAAEFMNIKTMTGATGQAASVVLMLMVTSSISTVRRKHFETFWFTHHLFVLFFGLLMVHGDFCVVKSDDPEIGCAGAAFWKFWLASGILYFVERVVREIRGGMPTHVYKVIQHPSNVVEVQIKKDSCMAKPGQYIFLCCPEISRYQWHPFTLTSVEQEDFISVHVRATGDWTKDFAGRLGCVWDKKGCVVLEASPKSRLPRLLVDGPYGTASEDIFDFEISVCVGAGIGVTPFASILKSIWYRIQNPTSAVRLQKVYFYWICREKEAFEWFVDLLSAIEEQHIDRFLSINIYLTGTMNEAEVNNVMVNHKAGVSDGLTGLRSTTSYGRPNLDLIFQQLARDHAGTDVGVFFCGPKPLDKQLHAACNKYTMGDEHETRFYYRKENF
ncbi:ferric reductase NAD binding domain-containing protein [Polychytrium aggregatum]|uniref:ferric reductase NAD binding domain-containing protein n=1 Tax=Polychytrium aggregatum TaxID=110093 RepID=UPI0022FDD21D|nr:ferric reductase NAD binding domain-containing protein [Polychytrium aggregatum]KAI9207285.1 ferric reductase NAD binding domain-containing protein [Polychytrium aggregatum]